MGTDFVENLRLTNSNLLQTVMLIKKANETAIDIIGVVITEMKVKGQNTVIKQIVYIASNTTRVFLSREACEELDLIPEKLPKIGLELNHMKINSITNEEGVRELVEINTPIMDLNKTIPLFQRFCSYKGMRANCYTTDGKLVVPSSQSTYPSEENYSPVGEEAQSKEIGLKEFQQLIHEQDEIENKCLEMFKEHRLETNHVPGKFHKAPTFGLDTWWTPRIPPQRMNMLSPL